MTVSRKTVSFNALTHLSTCNIQTNAQTEWSSLNEKKGRRKLPLIVVCWVILLSFCQSMSLALTHCTTYCVTAVLLGGFHLRKNVSPCGCTFNPSTGSRSEMYTTKWVFLLTFLGKMINTTWMQIDFKGSTVLVVGSGTNNHSEYHFSS